ncbi:major facilitator family transporter [Cystobacter fuscus DSM 2262]|uniref:Major facilitator family transporter n=1 Tax=Cystobacter fuscus (strain ATCC 25194 / DSM 2262 / NBRC 100088 / M29) TaxID=1242864 RepID=S9QI22_CYSF2|nr:MFS transporter [Cystobacter fuscus]EPX56088.1 major facilitator family transporter [Cystobacter fuscus DSM 2262]
MNDTATGAIPQPLYSSRYKNLVLALLVLAYTFNFVDRTIIATIGQAIKVDLKISDTQLGLLGGLYFALLYTLLGIPIARIAERSSRVNIISWAIVIWSGFTALCGMAANFAQLALFRFGVGVGEAGLTPPAHSLISDYFEPRKRASALSVYSFGLPLGVMFGAVMGGWLAQNYSWRVAFMAVGLPGVLIALAIKLLIQEPPRGHSESSAGPAPAPHVVADAPARTAPTLAAELKELGVVARAMLRNGPVLHMSLGITLASIGSYGSGTFVPPYFIRTFGLNFTQVGIITGLVSGFSSGIGTLLGGFVADRLSQRSPRWYALTPAIGLAIAAPIYITAYMQDSWKTAAFILLLPGIFHYTYMGPTFGVVQNAVETRRRATAAALLLFFLNLISLGGGPPFAGWVIDHFAAFNHAHPGVDSLFASLGGFFSAAPQTFQAACPGGAAPVGATADVVSHCAGSLALATRQGIILLLCFYFWAAFHYLLASFGLARK